MDMTGLPMSKKRKVFDALVSSKEGITAEVIAERTNIPLSTVKVYLDDFHKASVHVEQLQKRTNGGASVYRFDAMGVSPDSVYDSIKSTQAEKKQQLKEKLATLNTGQGNVDITGIEEVATIMKKHRVAFGPAPCAPVQQTVELLIKLKLKVQIEVEQNYIREQLYLKKEE